MDHPLTKYRKARDLSQEEAAAQLGLSSKSSLSNIESRLRDAPIRLGLQIQVWSAGHIQAVDVVSPDDRKLLEDAAAFARVAA